MSNSTDSEGKVLISDTLAEMEIIVAVQSEATGEPLAGVNVSVTSDGDKLLTWVEDPTGEYLPGLFFGSHASLETSINRSHLGSTGSVLAAPSKEISVLVIIVLVLAAISIYQSADSIVELAVDPPELIAISTSSADFCFTSDQLVNAIGTSKIVLLFVPIGGSAAQRVIVSSSEFVFVKVVKFGVIQSVDDRIGLRLYYTPNVPPMILPYGTCNSSVFPTISISPNTAISGAKVSVEGRNFVPSITLTNLTLGGSSGLSVPPSPPVSAHLPSTGSSGGFTTEFLVPPLATVTYSVVASAGGVTATTSFAVNPSGIGAVSSLAQGSLAPLGDNLAEIWRFDNHSRVWQFYLPHLVSEGINTIIEMIPGQIYWVRLNSTQEAILNGKQRNLGEGWSLIVS